MNDLADQHDGWTERLWEQAVRLTDPSDLEQEQRAVFKQDTRTAVEAVGYQSQCAGWVPSAAFQAMGEVVGEFGHTFPVPS